MRKILVTGMSGTGKSTVLAKLRQRGFDVVDTDEESLTVWSDEERGFVWREDEVGDLLDRSGMRTLYVAGCVSNQGRFYPRFDAVVLLSAPADVLLRRIATRRTNGFGKTPSERAAILADLSDVEPLLRATCTHELDATQPVEAVVAQLIAIGAG